MMSRLFPTLAAAALMACSCLPSSAQQPAPSSESSSQSSSDKAAPVPNDQQPPADQTSPDDQSNDTGHGSKIKRKLKEAAPSCIGFAGGVGKCRHSKESREEQQKEIAEQQLRQHCRDAADQGKPEDQPCADLRKRDAAHDVSVGDDYFQDKHYPSAENRYRLALQEDPTNAPAMLHLAQVLEKTGHNTEASQQYENFLNTNPQDPDAKFAREALDRLRSPATPASR